MQARRKESNNSVQIIQISDKSTRETCYSYDKHNVVFIYKIYVDQKQNYFKKNILFVVILFIKNEIIDKWKVLFLLLVVPFTSSR